MDALDIGCLLASAVVVLYTFFMIFVAHARLHKRKSGESPAYAYACDCQSPARVKKAECNAA